MRFDPIALAVLMALAGSHAQAQLRLPAILGDHALLQAGKPIQVWGWAASGATIDGTFQTSGAARGESFHALADAHGRWAGTLAPLKDGDAGTLEIVSDRKERIVLHDLLVGEVWLAGGQSNMVYPIAPGNEFLFKDDPALAIRDCYAVPGEVDNPRFERADFQRGTVRLRFTNAQGLRVRGGGDVKGFALRGAQGDWVWANGRVEGETIVVWSEQVPHPTAVRYAWAQNPVISIENRAGLPLSPFRTDTSSPR